MSNGMQEDSLKEKFVLLSKIAKEKKYAQEYLGLLARRGDIGSIRIGKRWYTTWQWFEEFLENSQKKKSESVCEVKITRAEKNEKEVAAVPAKSDAIKINFGLAFPAREKVTVSLKTENISIVQQAKENVVSEVRNIISQSRPDKPRAPVSIFSPKTYEMKSVNAREMVGAEEKTNIPFFQKMESRSFQKNTTSNARRNIGALDTRDTEKKRLQRKISLERRNKQAVPYQEIRFKKNAGVVSPDFSIEDQILSSIFPKFAFAVGFATILFFIAASGYFVYSGGIFNEGSVAGASDERNAGFSGIKSGGEYFVARAGDKIKESLSVSRLMVEAAKEKLINNNQ